MESTESRWSSSGNISQEWQILTEIQNMMTETKCAPEQLQGRIIYLSMKNDIVWENKETEKLVLRILLLLQNMLENSLKDIGCSLACTRK